MGSPPIALGSSASGRRSRGFPLSESGRSCAATTAAARRSPSCAKASPAPTATSTSSSRCSPATSPPPTSSAGSPTPSSKRAGSGKRSSGSNAGSPPSHLRATRSCGSARSALIAAMGKTRTRSSLRAEPSTRTYAELREATTGFREPSLRETALARLRELGDVGGRSQAVRAQLDDGDIEGAWRDAEEGGCTPALWRTLADARRADHPEDALGVYRRLLERALEHSHAGAYEEAIDLLREIRTTLELGGRGHEFQSELDRVRAEQRRRPKLLAMLADETW